MITMAKNLLLHYSLGCKYNSEQDLPLKISKSSHNTKRAIRRRKYIENVNEDKFVLLLE